MKFSSSAALLISCAASVAVASLPEITIMGNAFWNSETGERFYIRGVDYAPSSNGTTVDNLADEDICTRDIEYLQDLGVNTIRVYSVDNSLNHDACMEALDDAGIYLLLDVNTDEASISRTEPACSYNADYLQAIFSTVDAFSNYTNVLGFFAGNEVINDQANTTAAAPYVKAVVRDLKNYIKARDYRSIPVGYSAADVTQNVYTAAKYFNCGNDSEARIDFFGVNDYSWCGDSSFTTSGYDQFVEKYSNYSVPVFFSEYGCNTAGDSRAFTEVESIYSDDMSSVLSGGLVYEYSEEDNNYGLVSISDGEVVTLTDYTNLKKELNETENPSGDGGYGNYSVAECPTSDGSSWDADTSLPAMPSAASVMLTSGAGEPLGTGIGNTQWGCYDSSNSFISSGSSSSESSSESSSTGSSESSSSNSAATASSSASSSSAGAGSALVVPGFYHVIYDLTERSLYTLVFGFFAASAIAIAV